MNKQSPHVPDSVIEEVLALRAQLVPYEKIAKIIEKKHGIEKSVDNLRHIYARYKHLHDVEGSPASLKTLKALAAVRRANSKLAKENKATINTLLNFDDILVEIKEAVKAISKVKVDKAPRPKKGRTNLTMEALISDVHIGKRTETFNLEVCRKRLRHFTTIFKDEVTRSQAHYNVEKILLSFLGDNQEGARIHGMESMVGCEFNNPEQIRWVIQLFLEEIILPLSILGIPIEIVVIAGNHSRDGEKQTYHNPGKESFDWAIFQALKLMCDHMGLRHITWTIPQGAYHVVEIYGSYFLLEHGHFIKGGGKQPLANHLANRSAQTGKILSGLRIGHWHEPTSYGAGRILINGSVCGLDSYADVNGYLTEASQTINFYVETQNRSNPYWHSKIIQLEEIR